MEKEEFKKMTREELKSWIDMKKDFVLIDVLSEGSYNTKHLPGAVHAAVRETDFHEKVDKLAPDMKKPIVVYCASFTCQLSPLAAHKLVEMGYEDVYDFEGGLADWQDAGYPFEGENVEKKSGGKCDCCK